MYIFKEQDSIYDWISCIIKEKIYFGPYPNQLMVNRLIEEKFDVIVDLTKIGEEEKYNIYNAQNLQNIGNNVENIGNVEYINYPIDDNSYPENSISYCSFITNLKYSYFINKKIYIHCRGGHGRSSMVSISLVSSLFDYDLKTSIDFVCKSHNDRVVLRSKWKRKKSPFNYLQFLFLNKIHKNIYLNLNKCNRYYNWLSINQEKFNHKNNEYKNFYDFINNFVDTDEKLSENDKFLIFYEYMFYKIYENKELRNKLELTYLRKFVINDFEDSPKISRMYSDVLCTLRDSLYFNM
jgi:hypothetical protein